MLSNENAKEIWLVLLSVAIGLISQPIRKLADSLYSMSWGLTMNEWVGIAVTTFAIWLILRYLSSINDAIERKKTAMLLKGISQAFDSSIDKYTKTIVAAIDALRASIEKRE